MNLRFIPDDMNWICHSCNVALQPGIVDLRYMENVFRVELPICPQCAAVLISEDLAVGKMLEVEQLLEDK
jgi:Zn-finger nucleic acid-binding protein